MNNTHYRTTIVAMVAVSTAAISTCLAAANCNPGPPAQYRQLADVGAYEAWNWAAAAGTTLRGSGVRVAIFDEGVSCSHESLCGHFATVDGTMTPCRATSPPFCARGNGFDFQDRDESADGWDRQSSWYSSHGTMSASMVVGSTPDVGAAPEANILSVRIGGPAIVDDETLAQAVMWSAEHGADIINFSKAWQTEYPKTQAAIARVAGREYGHGRGILVTASTRNGSFAVSQNFAGAYASLGLPNVLAVTALSENDWLAYYNQDPAEEHLVAAPGMCMLAATGTAGNSGAQQGSSLSAPLVAGLAADLWSYPPFSKLTAQQLRCAIVEGSKQIGRRAIYNKNAPSPGTRSTIPVADLSFVTKEEMRDAVLERCVNGAG